MLLLTLFVIGLAVWGLSIINQKKRGQVIGLICIVLSFLAWIVFCAINIKIEDDTIKVFSAKTRSDLASEKEMAEVPVGALFPHTTMAQDSNRLKYQLSQIDDYEHHRLPAAFKTLTFYREHPRLVFWVSGWPDPTSKFEAISQWLDSPLNWSAYPAKILGPIDLP